MREEEVAQFIEDINLRSTKKKESRCKNEKKIL